MRRPVTAPTVISRLGSASDSGPDALRDFLEELVAAVAKAGSLVLGEAEPGRYVLVMPAAAQPEMQAQIDGALDVVLGRLGERWPQPHVTDFGLKELYAKARNPWLYGICRQIAEDHGMAVPTTFEEYLRTGRVRVTGMNAFAIDVFANAREMAANFDPIDHLIAKLLVLAEIKEDATLMGRVSGQACAVCGAFVSPKADVCASCGAPVRQA